MDRLEEALLARLETALAQVNETFPVLRNLIAGTYDDNLADIRGRLSPIVHGVSLAADEMRKLVDQYGGFREH